MTIGNREGDPIAGIRRDLEQADRRRASLVRASVAVAAVLLTSSAVFAAAVGVADPAEKPSPVRRVAPLEPLISAAAPVPASPTPSEPRTAPEPTLQTVSLKIGAYGYEPAVVRVKAGVPVALSVGRGEGCAAGFLMPKLGISADNSQGPVTVQLPALKAGTYRFSCGMDMVSGELVAR